MEINEFCEKVLGIELQVYQKEFLEKFKDQKIIFVQRHLRLGKNYFQKLMEEKLNG